MNINIPPVIIGLWQIADIERKNATFNPASVVENMEAYLDAGLNFFVDELKLFVNEKGIRGRRVVQKAPTFTVRKENKLKTEEGRLREAEKPLSKIYIWFSE